MKRGHIVANALVGVATVLLLVFGIWMLRGEPNERLPYRSAFDKQMANEWQPFGGTWVVNKGIMRNVSDERGAKLMTGSSDWKDYTVEADMRILDSFGDAGIAFRTSKEELGVDAYRGHYAGLRPFDNTFFIGSANFGWAMEAPTVPAPAPITPLTWFHIKIVSIGCRFAASATDISSGRVSYVAMEDPNCARAGRIGLRSLTGTEWKNVLVTPARPTDLDSMLSAAKTQKLLPAPPHDQFNSANALRFPAFAPLGPDTPAVSPINLLYLSPVPEKLINIRGVVTLLQPQLFIQDETAGIEVHAKVPDDVVLNLGDEIEVLGSVAITKQSPLKLVTVQARSLRLLSARSPVTPIVVTPLQAATDDYVGRLIETEGEVTAVDNSAKSLLIHMVNGPQVFVAIVEKPTGGLRAPAVQPHSHLRLRGVCSHDVRDTTSAAPFALLMRSVDDVIQVTGPPWWTTRHLLEWAVALFALALLLQAYHGRMQRQKRSAITDERERLAHELHDTLAQSFAGVAFQLQAIRNKVRAIAETPYRSLENQLDLAVEFVRQTHQEATLSIAMLRSKEWEEQDLISSLRRSILDLTPPGLADVQVSGGKDPRDIPLRHKEAFFHIGREALVNAVRHSNAKRIVILIRCENDSLSLEVHDDGQGFVRDHASRRLGLKGMERRAALIGASLCIDSTPGTGTVVRISAAMGDRGRSGLTASRATVT